MAEEKRALGYICPECGKPVYGERTAFALNAAAVVLAHNHVSGIAFPSEDDVATTDSLAPLLARLGVELVDHLIFVDDDMVSLRDSGFYRP